MNDIIVTILRRRSLLFKCLLGVLLLAVLYLAVAKRRYRAEAQMQLLSQNLAIEAPAAADSDSSLQLAVNIETYIGVLTSDNLALQIIHELKLEDTPEFGIKPGSLRGDEAKREEGLPLEQTRFRREKMLQQFKRSLAVSSVSGSRLINVSFLSTNPELAKKILDQLLTDFIAYNYNVRYSASTDTEGWLAKQLVDLKKNVEETQQKAADLQHQTGLYGNDGSHDLVLARLEAINQELINAEQNRIVKEAILHVVHSGNPESVSNLLGNAGQASTPEAVNALALIQSLRQQETSLTSQLAELTSKYGSNYPRVIETGDQLAAVRQDIAKETRRLTERAENDYAAARDQEKGLRQQFDTQKQTAVQANDLSIQYLIANREATSSRDLYEHLLEKLKETGIMAGLHDTNINVIDGAHVGAAPASPNRLMILGGALAGGLLLGLLAVFLSEGLDRTMHDPKQIKKSTGRPLLGVIPVANRSEPNGTTGSDQSLWKAAEQWPRSSFTEAFRSVRTLTLRTLPNKEIKTIVVTSPSKLEGKSTVAFNLAGVFAQQGLRVLVIDADLRQRGLSTMLGLANLAGFSNLLASPHDQLGSSELIRKEGRVDILPAGTLMDNPSELLGSAKADALLAELKNIYDYILIDSKPLLGVTDSLVFSQKADAAILVCRDAVTSKTAFELSFNLLRELEVNVLGTVFNAVDVASPEYTYLYGGGNAGRGFLARTFGLGNRSATYSRGEA